MATPVFCCGAECGVDTPSAHGSVVGTGSFSTTTFRTGLRSRRLNPTASTSFFEIVLTASNTRVPRMYVRFATLPSADCIIVQFGDVGSAGPNIIFDQSESKLYAAVNTTRGASGISIIVDTWYRLDCHFFVGTAGNDTCDLQVDGVAAGQASAAGLIGTGFLNMQFGILNTCTADMFIDDLIISNTAADYPLGAGYVLSYIPNADGTHNITGGGDFEDESGVDFSNASTDVWTHVSKRPLSTTITSYVNLLAPPNAEDWVSVQFEDSVEPLPPRAVEILWGIHAASTSANNLRLHMNHDDVVDGVNLRNATVGSTTIIFERAHWATDLALGGSAWSQGGFNNLRTLALSSDANPDPRWDSIMIEAEYVEDTGIDITPSPVAIPIVIPAPQVAVNTIVTPSAVAIPIIVSAPTVSKSYSVVPTPVAVLLSVQAPTISHTLTISPSPVAVSLVIATPQVMVNTIVTPSPVAIQIVIPAPVLSYISNTYASCCSYSYSCSFACYNRNNDYSKSSCCNSSNRCSCSDFWSNNKDSFSCSHCFGYARAFYKPRSSRRNRCYSLESGLRC